MPPIWKPVARGVDYSLLYSRYHVLRVLNTLTPCPVIVPYVTPPKQYGKREGRVRANLQRIFNHLASAQGPGGLSLCAAISGTYFEFHTRAVWGPAATSTVLENGNRDDALGITQRSYFGIRQFDSSSMGPKQYTTGCVGKAPTHTAERLLGQGISYFLGGGGVLLRDGKLGNDPKNLC